MGWPLIQYDWCPDKKWGQHPMKTRHTWGGHHAMTDRDWRGAAAGREGQGQLTNQHQKPGRGEEGPSSMGLIGSPALLTSSGLPVSRTFETVNFCCFSAPRVWHFDGSPRRLVHSPRVHHFGVAVIVNGILVRVTSGVPMVDGTLGILAHMLGSGSTVIAFLSRN